MTALLSKRITIDVNICHGKPVIRGLRYPVENILEWLSAGMSIDEILADYEDLEKEDILAALFSKNLSALIAALEIYDFVEITRSTLRAIRLKHDHH